MAFRTLVACVAAFAPIVAQAETRDIRIDILNHVACYPRGLDEIAAGNYADGLLIWRSCFTPDYRFELNLGDGGPTICPGEACQISGNSSIEKRAAFTRDFYQRMGFIKAFHSLSNLVVHYDVETGKAGVETYVTGIHFQKDGFIVSGFGSWTADLIERDGVWLITRETLSYTIPRGLEHRGNR